MKAGQVGVWLTSSVSPLNLEDHDITEVLGEESEDEVETERATAVANTRQCSSCREFALALPPHSGGWVVIATTTVTSTKVMTKIVTRMPTWMPIGRGRDAYRDVYGKREGWGCLHGCLWEGRGMLIGMPMGRGRDGDAHRDSHRKGEGCQ